MRNHTVFLIVATALGAACGDATGPGDGGLPGRRILDAREFSQWVWTPGGDEIVFSTPFDAPYTGPPTRLEAINVASGSRRTIVAAPSNGDHIIGYRFVVAGSHVYYEVADASGNRISFYRTPLGGGTSQKIIDVSPYGVSVAPDERMVAWVERDSAAGGWTLVTTDIGTATSRKYPLKHDGNRVTWSPSGRSVVVDPSNVLVTAGTPLQWVDLASGSVRVWLEPRTAESQTRDIGWDGETPVVYVAGVDLARYSMATGNRELLSALAAPGLAVGWSRDFETAFIESNECRKWSGGVFGSDCIQWANRTDRIAWRSGVKTPVVRFEARAQTFGRASPTGAHLGYTYYACGGGCYSAGDGLYVERIP